MHHTGLVNCTRCWISKTKGCTCIIKKHEETGPVTTVLVQKGKLYSAEYGIAELRNKWVSVLSILTTEREAVFRCGGKTEELSMDFTKYSVSLPQ